MSQICLAMRNERYLRLLSEKFPNAQSVITEIINLRAILSLPKGTEHFVSDLHGESSVLVGSVIAYTLRFFFTSVYLSYLL